MGASRDELQTAFAGSSSVMDKADVAAERCYYGTFQEHKDSEKYNSLEIESTAFIKLKEEAAKAEKDAKKGLMEELESVMPGKETQAELEKIMGPHLDTLDGWEQLRLKWSPQTANAQ
jgi:hypothetical protein